MIFITTVDQVRSIPEGSNNTLQPCNQEEADSRMFLHMDNAAISGHTSFMIRTKDTDVVVYISSSTRIKEGPEHINFKKVNIRHVLVR